MEVFSRLKAIADGVEPPSPVAGLLADVERLEAAVADLTERLERCSRATDDQKARWWMKKYDDLVQSTRRNDFDQT